MKRIVICCDGTWASADSRHPTNVAKIAGAVLPTDASGVAQTVRYQAGLGTGPAMQGIERWLAGAVGAGLARNVKGAYAELAALYAPGDEIFLFGYSRGAYTARSLAGMIRACGIVAGGDARAVEAGFALYRDTASTADGVACRAFRARHAAATYLTDDEPEWRRARGYAGAAPQRLRIAYIGVWDTVGALGVPKRWLFSERLNRRHGFHDHRLSGCVAAARHAVSLDEDRAAFEPTLWSNLPEAPDGPDADATQAPYRQSWFPGVHGSVGGGGTLTHHSDDALAWIAEGAARAGLAIDQGHLAAWRSAADPMGPLHTGAPGKLGWLRRAPRMGPKQRRDISRAALLRWKAAKGTIVEWPYRPAGLSLLEREKS